MSLQTTQHIGGRGGCQNLDKVAFTDLLIALPSNLLLCVP